MNKQKILNKVEELYNAWKSGLLGGEVMPEDENPNLEKGSLENYLYFTLPMALNYQRNSYKLWESAKQTYLDKDTNFVFYPNQVLNKSFAEVQAALTKYKVALQATKQTEIWIKLCETFVELFNGDIRKLFTELNKDVNEIRDFIQIKNKKKFPYLSGTKICNYWLYVIYQYTDMRYKNIECLTVAPDTHVVKATHKLGLITNIELNSTNVQAIVIEKWNKIFAGTKYKPIDIHTPLWLWSRNGFLPLDKNDVKEIRFCLPEGEYWFLSPYSAHPFQITVDGQQIMFPTVEHYYQAMKFNANDPRFMEILKIKNPDDTRLLTKKPEYKINRREDFEERKFEIMKQGLLAKFSQNKDAMNLLLSTGNSILIKHCAVCYKCGFGEGSGKNELGKMLMEIRQGYI